MDAMTTRLDPATQRLLLLTARETWDDAQQSRAVQLANDVSDWNRFCEVSSDLLGAGLVHRALASLPSGTVPAEVIQRLRTAARAFALRSLSIEAALLEFKADCLDALGIRHAFFKGAALAHRYYQSPALRACRDVDVLIDQEHAVELVRHALSRGYVPAEHVREGDQGIIAWVKRTTVYPMLAPNGMLIEIHRLLDKGDGLFDSGQMLSRAEIMSFRGKSLSVLRTADLFAYICVHHTKHFWSHLHWYADLDAISRHPLFDLDEVREAATGARVVSTLEASLQLHALARYGNWSEHLSPSQKPGEDLLIKSIACLAGGLEYEHSLQEKRLSRTLRFGWQVDRPRRIVLFVRWAIYQAYRSVRKPVSDTLKAILPERVVEWIRRVKN